MLPSTRVNSVLPLVAPAGLRLLALDIDGTIAPFEGLPSPEVVAALHEVHATGIELMVVTGRPAHLARDVATALALDELWIASSNGAVTSRATPRGYEIVAVETFDPRPAVAAVRALDSEAGIVLEQPGEGYRPSRDLPSAIAQEPHLPFTHIPEATPFLALASRTLTRPELLAAVADTRTAIMPWRWDEWQTLDITPAHVSKATAVRDLARRRGLNAAQCAAVGDYLNDIPMLRWAGWGVAMGQAPQEVHDAADAVAPSFEDDGVLAVLAALVASRK